LKRKESFNNSVNYNSNKPFIIEQNSIDHSFYLPINNDINVNNSCLKFSNSKPIQNLQENQIFEKETSSNQFVNVTAKPPKPPPLPTSKTPLSAAVVASKTTSEILNKSINWEKIENKNLEGTFWEKIMKNSIQLDDVLSEIHIKDLNNNNNKTQINNNNNNSINRNNTIKIKILNDKKAYNIGIICIKKNNSFQIINYFLKQKRNHFSFIEIK